MSRTTAEAVERIFRNESGRILATLIRTCGDFDLAEDALQDALTLALQAWTRDGAPANPAGWITTTARRRLLDRLRRDRTYATKLAELESTPDAGDKETGETMLDIADDRLRLIFTCCHPALAPEAQVALTLHTLGGLSTPEIARAFLVAEPTMAQRLVRVKRKIRDARIPYEVPDASRLPERLVAVLSVIYLVFNEGYSASHGDSLIRRDLCAEATRLGRVLCNLMPDEPEALGLLALMLLHDARRGSRIDEHGDLVTLEEQDRSQWDRRAIDEGSGLVERASRMRRAGPYQLQAAIAALHCGSPAFADTDWPQIAALYAELYRLQPSPVVALNRAVAVAMADGPDAGLSAIRHPEMATALEGYHPYQATLADLLRRAGRKSEAAVSYRRAIALAANQSERAYLQRRLRECE